MNADHFLKMMRVRCGVSITLADDNRIATMMDSVSMPFVFVLTVNKEFARPRSLTQETVMIRSLIACVFFSLPQDYFDCLEAYGCYHADWAPWVNGTCANKYCKCEMVNYEKCLRAKSPGLVSISPDLTCIKGEYTAPYPPFKEEGCSDGQIALPFIAFTFMSVLILLPL